MKTLGMIERVKRFLRPRWRVAEFFNRYRDTCWARLVDWARTEAMSINGFDVLYLRNTAGWCARAGDTPYCNKCAVTGLHMELREGGHEPEREDKG